MNELSAQLDEIFDLVKALDEKIDVIIKGGKRDE
jgi:hypothetical protein